MYLTSLKIKNYKLIENTEIAFQRGMNVLVGKNSTGKSTVLEAIHFLLSPIPGIVPGDIIPYSKRSINTNPSVEGVFELSDSEIKLFLESDIPDNERAEYEHLMEECKLTVTKSIIKSGNSYAIRPLQIKIWPAGAVRNINKTNRIINAILPKINAANIIKLPELDNIDHEPLKPAPQLYQIIHQQPQFIFQYIRLMAYEAKQRGNGEYKKIREALLNAYQDVKDINIEFDVNTTQLNIFFTSKAGDYKMSLNNESLGIREFFYTFLTLCYFPDTVVLKDEALIHMHKSLLADFLSAIDGQPYQMIITSHIKELITSLDFGNIIVCRKKDGKTEITNLLKHDDIQAVLSELGYADKIQADVLDGVKYVSGR